MWFVICVHEKKQKREIATKIKENFKDIKDYISFVGLSFFFHHWISLKKRILLCKWWILQISTTHQATNEASNKTGDRNVVTCVSRNPSIYLPSHCEESGQIFTHTNTHLQKKKTKNSSWKIDVKWSTSGNEEVKCTQSHTHTWNYLSRS